MESCTRYLWGICSISAADFKFAYLPKYTCLGNRWCLAVGSVLQGNIN
jgi:hypothetical protein